MHRSYELKMPVEYVELSAEEMEYDGGAWNFAVAIICSIASFGCDLMAERTGDDKWKKASLILTGASMALSFGGAKIVSAGAKIGARASTKFLAKVFNPTKIGVDDYLTIGNITTILSFPTDFTGGLFLVNDLL